MPFYISYTLLTGVGTRSATTAAEAIIVYNELREIGAGGIGIKDEKGVLYTVEQLALVVPPNRKRDRDHGPSV